MSSTHKKDSNQAAVQGQPPAAQPHHPGIRSTRLAAWMRRFQFWNVWPMFILSNIFVVLSSYVLFLPKDLSPSERAWMLVVLGILAIIFAADFGIRLLFAPDRPGFVKQNWLEPVAIFIPPLRPLMVLFYVWRLPLREQHPKRDMRLRYQMTIAVIAIVLTYAISIWVWQVERLRPGATIKNWGDSLWWAVATITTVGYGDVTPITATGRVLGTFLMVGGTLVLGVVSASVISGLSDKWKEMSATRAERVRREQEIRRERETDSDGDHVHKHHEAGSVPASGQQHGGHGKKKGAAPQDE